MLETRSVSLHTDHVASYDGQYLWTGRVVAVSSRYALLMDWEGRLARIVRCEEEVVVVAESTGGRGWYATLEGAICVSATDMLLRRPAVRQAIALAMRADYDPANFDRWMIPLRDITTAATLAPTARAYLRWPAIERRCFEAALEGMQGSRQRQVYMQNVLGATDVRDLRRQEGLGRSAIRTARWRARRNITAAVGHLAR